MHLYIDLKHWIKRKIIVFRIILRGIRNHVYTQYVVVQYFIAFAMYLPQFVHIFVDV